MRTLTRLGDRKPSKSRSKSTSKSTSGNEIRRGVSEIGDLVGPQIYRLGEGAVAGAVPGRKTEPAFSCRLERN